MSAELLRRAADFIEQRATVAMPAPWECLDGGDRILSNPDNSDEEFEYVVDEPVSHEGNAEWIAMLGPQVAAPIVAWLRSSEAWIKETGDAGLVGGHRAALDFARAILGEATP